MLFSQIPEVGRNQKSQYAFPPPLLASNVLVLRPFSPLIAQASGLVGSGSYSVFYGSLGGLTGLSFLLEECRRKYLPQRRLLSNFRRHPIALQFAVLAVPLIFSDSSASLSFLHEMTARPTSLLAHCFFTSRLTTWESFSKMIPSKASRIPLA